MRQQEERINKKTNVRKQAFHRALISLLLCAGLLRGLPPI